MMRKLICLMLFLLCLCLPALAEDVCVVPDASAAGHLTTSCSYLQVECPLSSESAVVLSVRDEWGSLIYQRDYGPCSGRFRSQAIPLPLPGDTCEYTITLATDSAVHAFVVTREQPLLTDTAYACGLPLKEINGGSSRKYAVVLDLAALRQDAVMPLLCGGMQVGDAVFSMQGGQLVVSANLSVQGKIDKATVYIATDALSATTLGTSRFSGVKTRLDRAIPLGNAAYAAVMVQLTISYDPATAQDAGSASLSREEMRDAWQLMQITTANEAVG